MDTVTLNNGVEVPILGFGVFQIDADKTEAAVTAAFTAGYRHIDTAESYQNEAAVGAAIARSGLPREELFITTKLFVQDAGEDNTLRSFDRSLSRLGLDHVDLYLIHQPFGDYYAEWRAMERIYAEGRARAIGVSNFPGDRLIDLILNNDVTPAVNQVETNPFQQQTEYQQLLLDEKVQMEAWAPFAEGKNDLFHNAVLVGIGQKYDKSVAQVVLRWLVQRKVIALAKSVNPDRMAQNIDVFDFTLTEQDMAQIATLDQGASQFFDHAAPDMVRWLSARRIPA